MSDKKISELNTFEPSEEYGDVYVPCVQVSNGSQTPYKFNLGNLADSLNNVYNSVIGNDQIPIFDQNVRYSPGDFVRYNDPSTNKTEIWKFTQSHQGAWNQDDAMKTSIYNELKTMSSGVEEHIHCLVYRKLNDGTINNLGTGSIYIEYNGNKSSIDITNGKASFTIPFGTIYNIYVGQDVTGYSTPPPYNNLISNVYDRYLNFEYIQNQSGSTSVNISLTIPNDISNLLQSSRVSNTSVYLLENNSNTFSGVPSGILDENLQTTISNVTIGKEYKVCWSIDNSYAIRNYFIIPQVGTNEVEIPIHKIIKGTLEQSYNNIYIVTNSFFEISISTFLEKKNNNETILDSENNEILDSEWVSIHVYSGYNNNDTSFIDLSQQGCDYYVKLVDLFKPSGYTTKTWLSQSSFLKSVSTYSYDGKRDSYFMVYQAKELFTNSNAAQWANSQTYNYTANGNNIIMRGFVGSRYQLSILLNPDNARNLYDIANKLSINSNNNYIVNTDTSAEAEDSNAYYPRSIWTSNQPTGTSASTANAVKWSFVDNRSFVSNPKTSSCTVIPFFSPY